MHPFALKMRTLRVSVYDGARCAALRRYLRVAQVLSWPMATFSENDFSGRIPLAISRLDVILRFEKC
jgi:hypothetical protein